MITTTKNKSYICLEDVCGEQMKSCVECDAHAESKFHPFEKFLRELWINIRLFLGTDRWGGAVTLQRGDSHYTMKMEDIEARWRNK